MNKIKKKRWRLIRYHFDPRQSSMIFTLRSIFNICLIEICGLILGFRVEWFEWNEMISLSLLVTKKSKEGVNGWGVILVVISDPKSDNKGPIWGRPNTNWDSFQDWYPMPTFLCLLWCYLPMIQILVSTPMGRNEINLHSQKLCFISLFGIWQFK